MLHTRNIQHEQYTAFTLRKNLNLNFRTNIEKTCEKAARVNTALSRIMTNIGGPNQSRRLLLAKVTQSIMMYTAPL